ncbi:hypothetical protein PT974_06526 [Cladobotryum mycophilum]|uniref:Protein kinase domain-containing protein n=1 Tax=Cladobotryum mycophilum TaxID=491253 RepID=A0ABR0SLV5_9HYPO
MAPVVARWGDLDMLCESFSKGRQDFLYTTFALWDEHDITLDQCTSALHPIPDEHLFPLVPPDETWTKAPEELSGDVYIKRPRLKMYDVYRDEDILEIIPALILEEAHTLQAISQHPHPGIIKYHSCRLQRGRITRLVLDKYEYDFESLPSQLDLMYDM